MRAVKIKIGESWGSRPDRDLERVHQARDEIGPGVQLFVDANGGYGVGQAVRLATALDAADVRWLEEPVSSDDLPGLRTVRDHTLADVAAGEYGDSLDYFHRLCAADAVDCVQVDMTRCGGVTELLRIAAVAAAASSTCRATARPTSTHRCWPPSRTCAISSTPRTTCASSGCSSTGPRRREPESSPFPVTAPATA